MLAATPNRGDLIVDGKYSDSNRSHTLRRFEYVDGLRGLASVMVAVSHIAHAAAIKHPGILGPHVEELADLGRYGVQIFFVLSGFVIAHSVMSGAHSFSYFGRFVGRRFVRLDVPYWSVIVLEIGLLWLSGKVMAGYMRDLPSLPEILSHAVYLQGFFGYQHILPVFWTLCYEVQFYLVFVLALVLFEKLRGAGISTSATRKAAAITLALSFCGSLAIYLGRLPNPHQALFVDRWFQFAFGIITYLYYRRSCGARWIVAASLACVLGGVLFGANAYRVTSVLLTAGTGLAILASWNFQWWNALLVGRTMQFLGRISYSLYLLHLCVGWRATVLVREMFGASYSTAHAYLAFAIGMAVSIAAAAIMYALIERPSIALARKIHLPQRESSAPGGAVAPAAAAA
jgi:peptidoglycan/LPS O-acetylase OafA/YrhL